MVDQELKDWVKNNSPFLKLGDGEVCHATYKGRKIVAARDPSKETVAYKLEVEFATETKLKIFQSASARVGNFFAETPIGAKVRITRHGLSSTDTRYDIAQVDDAGTVLRQTE